MVRKSCESGLIMFYLYIPPSEVERVEYVELLTCYRCYSVNEHFARNCMKDDSYIVRLICFVIGQALKSCESTLDRRVSKGGGHLGHVPPPPPREPNAQRKNPRRLKDLRGLIQRKSPKFSK